MKDESSLHDDPILEDMYIRVPPSNSSPLLTVVVNLSISLGSLIGIPHTSLFLLHRYHSDFPPLRTLRLPQFHTDHIPLRRL